MGLFQEVLTFTGALLGEEGFSGEGRIAAHNCCGLVMLPPAKACRHMVGFCIVRDK